MSHVFTVLSKKYEKRIKSLFSFLTFCTTIQNYAYGAYNAEMHVFEDNSRGLKTEMYVFFLIGEKHKQLRRTFTFACELFGKWFQNEFSFRFGSVRSLFVRFKQ